MEKERGNRRLAPWHVHPRALLGDPRLGVEAAQVWHEWTAFLKKEYDFVMTQEHEVYIKNFVLDKNLSWVDRRTFDLVRRHMVISKQWPPSMLTPDERLAYSLEETETPLDSWENRQWFARKSRELRPLPAPAAQRATGLNY